MLVLAIVVNGQLLPTTSPYASVTQRIGLTDVTISYFRPSVNGREVWGKLVPYGYSGTTFSTDDFSTMPERAAPWRTGANNATTIEFTTDVTIENTSLSKGKYALFIAPIDDSQADIILSTLWDQAGSFVYDKKFDAARIRVKTTPSEFKEEMGFEFNKVTLDAAEASLVWERKRIPFVIHVDTKKIVGDKLIAESYAPHSMNQNWRTTATVYMMNNKIKLDHAERWAQWLNTLPGAGFTQQTTYGNILLLQGKQAEADSLLNIAFSNAKSAGVGILIFYGNQVLSLELPDVAIRTYNTIKDVFPDNEWTVYYGLAKAYSMKKNYKEAVRFLKMAEKHMPENFDRVKFKNDLDKLGKGQDINA